MSAEVGLYEMTVTARRFRLVPWPRKTVTYQKATTRAEVDRFADGLRERGAEITIRTVANNLYARTELGA